MAQAVKYNIPGWVGWDSKTKRREAKLRHHLPFDPECFVDNNMIPPSTSLRNTTTVGMAAPQNIENSRNENNMFGKSAKHVNMFEAHSARADMAESSADN